MPFLVMTDGSLPDPCCCRNTQRLAEAQAMHDVAFGSASSRSSPIAPPHVAHVP